MTWTQSKDVSLIATRFFMKTIGLWLANNRDEKRWKKIALIYTFFIMSCAIFVLLIDICYTYRKLNVSVQSVLLNYVVDV